MTRDGVLSKLRKLEGRQVNVFVGGTVTIGRLQCLDRERGAYGVGASSRILAQDVERVHINGADYAQVYACSIYYSKRKEQKDD